MYPNTGMPGPSQDLKDLKPKRLLIILDFFKSCFVWAVSVGDYFLFLFLKCFSSLTYFLSVSLSPFLDCLTLFLLSLNPLLSSLLQVLKPLSEHYMEDNVRQTVVNSIRASLTEQGSQHTKLKTHWRSSSSSPPLHRLSPGMFITLLPTHSMCSILELWN